jgi:hypothetical protein
MIRFCIVLVNIGSYTRTYSVSVTLYVNALVWGHWCTDKVAVRSEGVLNFGSFFFFLFLLLLVKSLPRFKPNGPSITSNKKGGRYDQDWDVYAAMRAVPPSSFFVSILPSQFPSHCFLGHLVASPLVRYFRRRAFWTERANGRGFARRGKDERKKKTRELRSKSRGNFDRFPRHASQLVLNMAPYTARAEVLVANYELVLCLSPSPCGEKVNVI